MKREMPRRLRYPIAEAAHILGVGRTTLYGRVKEGKLDLVHDGRKALITADSLDRYCAAEARDASDFCAVEDER